MPMKPKRPCPGFGSRRGSCLNLLTGNERCCSECELYVKKQIRRYDKARDQEPGRQFIHSTVWRRIRAAKLARDPLCERCLKGFVSVIYGPQFEDNGMATEHFPRIVPAVLVHHIDGDELNNDPSNHQSLCVACHEAIHKGGRFGR